MSTRRSNRRKLAGLALGVASLVAVALVVLDSRPAPPPGRDSTRRTQPPPTETPSPACTVLEPGDDLPELVNGVTRQSFCLEPGTYDLGNDVLEPGAGSSLVGEKGSTAPRGPGVAIDAPVEIVGDGEAIVRPQGARVELRWLDVSGASGEAECKPVCGRGIDGSDAPRLSVRYVRSHHNDNNGAGGIEGGSVFDHVEVDHNGTPEFDGCCSGGLKGADQYEVRFSYIHDNHNNGVWCDAGCFEPSVPLRNGFWVHHSLIVDNWHNGIRYENSPKDSDDHPRALIANNEIHGNDLEVETGHQGGVVVNSAQNATVKGNRFGTAVIDGVRYEANGGAAIEFGGARTPLQDNEATANILGSEVIKGCDPPEVVCADNG